MWERPLKSCAKERFNTIMKLIKKNKDDSFKVNTKFARAIRKYGINNFRWTILHEGVRKVQMLNKLEEEEIRMHDCVRGGYNIEEVSAGGPRSKHTRKKISKTLKGHKPFAPREAFQTQLGKPRSEETKRKISETMKRKNLQPSKEAIKKSNFVTMKNYKLIHPDKKVVEVAKKQGVFDYFKKLNDELGLKGPSRINAYALLKHGTHKGYEVVK